MDISLAYRYQPAPSPQERDRICQLISRALALEELSRSDTPATAAAANEALEYIRSQEGLE